MTAPIYPSWGISPDYDDEITSGDMSVAVTYRITYASGETQESAPKVLTSGLSAENLNDGTLWASGQWLIIPTLRHLLPGTSAQIVIYLEGASTLQRFYVIDNDTTVDYIEFSPNGVFSTQGGTIKTITEAMEEVGISTDIDQPSGTEVLYTTGNNLPNDPPPQLDCICSWRNRLIGAFENTVYVSQEFAAGRGVMFSSYINVTWLDGTGDIKAVCPIDWNYLAVFKQDAVGVISGPGPDGVGHGNFIVQTISSKGCDNPLSLVGGDGAAYFQEADTLRIHAITGQLAVKEATPGWFNAGSYTVTATLQVEEQNQIWFATTEKAIIVLDTKHGRTFIWDVSAYASNIVGLTIWSGSPVAMLANGKVITYVEAQAYDSIVSGGSTTYSAINRIFETGELQPLNIMGKFDLSRVVVLGEYIGAHTWTIDAIPQFGSSNEPTAVTITAAPEQFDFRPSGCQRIQSVRVKLTEGTYNSTYTKGSKFVGVGLEVQPRDRLQRMNSGRSY